MEYYDVLKKRRMDLHLSVYDVAIQANLDKDGLLALERHDLDYFAHDLSEARELIELYCQAIGVNWLAIQPEADRDLMDYYQITNTSAYKQQIQRTPRRSAKARPAPVKRKRRLVKRGSLAGFICLAMLALLIANFLIEQAAQSSQEQWIASQQQQLKEKEEQTSRLAAQLKELQEQQSLRNEVQIESTEDPARFLVYGAIADRGKLLIELDLATPSSITIQEGNEILYMMRNASTASYDLSVSEPRQVQIRLSGYTPQDEILVGGESLPLYDIGQEDLVITLDISDEQPEEPEMWSGWADEYDDWIDEAYPEEYYEDEYPQ